MSVEYTPPVIDLRFISGNESPEGVLQSASFLLTDSLERLFALHVMKQEAHEASLLEDPVPEGEEAEPVLIITTNANGIEVIKEQVRNTPPEILSDFLVPQD